jgi:hypothetical protein
MRCDKVTQIRAPETLAKALTAAADKRLTSRSDYILASVLASQTPGWLNYRPTIGTGVSPNSRLVHR